MTSILPDGSIEFRFYRPGANGVHVAGTFNGWHQGETPMQSAGDGWWAVALPLAAGEYRFRYIADGRWFTDFAANGVESGKGGWNSILRVPSRMSVAA